MSDVPKPSAPELPHHVARRYGLTQPLPSPNTSPQAKAPKKRVRLPNVLTWVWRHKKVRYAIIVLFLAAMAGVIGYPHSRYAILNSAGVRSRASLTVIDETMRLPIGRVNVSIGGTSVQTDSEGLARLQEVRLGRNELKISAPGYETFQKHIIVGWGSNPLGQFTLKPQGRQQPVRVTNLITGKPISDAVVDIPEATTKSDKDGQAKVSVRDPAATKITVTARASGFLEKKIEITLGDAVPDIALTPSGKHVFAQREAGKLNVYSSNLDGTGKEKILAGSGLENAETAIVVSPNADYAAVVSTRDNERDARGYLKRTLVIIDLETKNANTIEHAEQLQLITWKSEGLVYVLGDSTQQPRQSITLYQPDTNQKSRLAASDEFGGVTPMPRYLLFVTDSDKEETKQLISQKYNGEDRKVVLTGDIWSVIRTTYTAVSIQVSDGWRSYDTNSTALETINTPAQITTTQYTDNNDNSWSVWSQQRLGLGTISAWNISEKVGHQVYAKDGVGSPLRFSGQYIIFRVSNGQETADYVTSLDGGAPQKITDVAMTYGYAKVF